MSKVDAINILVQKQIIYKAKWDYNFQQLKEEYLLCVLLPEHWRKDCELNIEALINETVIPSVTFSQ